MNLPKLPPILLMGHKKNRGHALVIAGSKEKSGAAILASTASMKAGVGLCTLALPSVAHTIIKSQLINVMSEEIVSDEKSIFLDGELDKLLFLIKDKTAVLMGPGLAPDSNRKKWVEEILKNLKVSFVLDAQALSDLGEKINDIKWAQHHVVVTPHEGEMSKLTGLSIDEIHNHRSEIASKFSKQWNITVVLKGYQTVVASPSGEIWVNQVDHPCLSVAGTGDVLAGILVSFLAQGLHVFDASKLAVHVHGRAAQLLGERMGVRGVLATDLFNEIPMVIRELDQNQIPIS